MSNRKQRTAIAGGIAPDQHALATGRNGKARDVGLECRGLYRRAAWLRKVEHPQLIATRFARDEVQSLAVRTERGGIFAGIGEVGDLLRGAAFDRYAP